MPKKEAKICINIDPVADDITFMTINSRYTGVFEGHCLDENCPGKIIGTKTRVPGTKDIYDDEVKFQGPCLEALKQMRG